MNPRPCSFPKSIFKSRAFLRRPSKRAALALALALLWSNQHVGAADTEDDVLAGASNLGTNTTATYTTVATTTSDVTFAAATTYANAGNFTLTPALSIGSLDDLNATAITINATALLTLNAGNGASNVVSTAGTNGGNATDVLFVANGASLTLNDTAGIQLTTKATSFDAVGTGVLNLGTTGINIIAAQTLSFLGSGTITVGGAIAATTGAVTINDAGGSTTFSGANLYTGATTVTAGTLNLSGSLGATAITANGGTLTEASTGVIGSTASLTLSNAASTVTLAGVNTYTGGNTVTAGKLKLSGTGTLGSVNGTLTVNGGVLDLNGTSQGVGNFTGTGGSIYNLSGAGTSTLTVGNNNGTGGTFAGLIADNDGVTTGGKVAVSKTGTGTIILSGTNTYTGGTTISAGGLYAQNGAATNVDRALGTGGVSLTGGTLYLKANGSGSTQTIITGDGTTGNNVTVGGSTTVDVNQSAVSGANSGNTFVLNNLSIGANTLTVTGGNTYALRFAGTTTLTGNATINPTTSNLTLAGNIGDGGSGFGFTKTGAGTLTLLGTNSYSGATTITTGILAARGAGALSAGSAVSLGSATLQVLNDGAGSNGTISLGNAITINTATTTDIINVGNNGSANTGNTVAFGLLSIGTVAQANAVTINFTGANGYLESFSSLALAGAGGNTTVLNPTTTSVTITGNVTNQETTTGTGHYDTLQLGGTSTGNFVNGAIADSSVYTAVSAGDTRVTMSGTGSWTLAGANTYHGPTSISAGTLNLTGSLANTQSVTTSGAGIFTESSAGVIGGTATFTQGSTGTVTLAGANTYSGGTTINSGTVVAGNTSSLGTGGLTFGTSNTPTLDLNGSSLTLGLISGTGTNGIVTDSVASTTPTLTLNGAGTSTFAGVIGNGNGTVSLSVIAGTEILAGANTYTGTTTVSGTGTLQIGNGTTGSISNSSVASTASGGTLAFDLVTGTTYANTITDNGTVAGAEGTGITNTLSGAISGGGGFSQTGAGTTILSTAEPFTGPIALTGTGTLQIAAGASLTASTAGQNITDNGTLLYSSSTPITLSGVISGTGGLTKDTGTAALTLTNANTISGTTTVSAGTIVLKNALALQNSIATNNVANGFVFDSSVTGNAFTFGALGGSSNLALLNNAATPAPIALTVGNNNASANYSGILSGAGASLTKIGTGTEGLGAANTYTGATLISGGILDLVNTTVLPNTSSITVGSGAFLRFSKNNDEIGFIGVPVGGAGGIIENINNPNQAITLDRPNTYTGPTQLVIRGGFVAGVASTYDASGNQLTGAFGVNSPIQFTNYSNGLGVMALNGNNNQVGSLYSNASGVGFIVLGGGSKASVLTIGGDNTSTTYQGVITDNNSNGNSAIPSGAVIGGSLVKIGTGTQTFTGANLYGGATTIAGGTLSISTIANGGVTTTASAADANTTTLAVASTSGLVVGQTLQAANLNAGGPPTITAIGTNSVTLSAAKTIASGAALEFGVGNGLGISTNAASNLVLDNGALQYVGTTVGSTDRLFQIGRSTDTGATTATIDSSSVSSTNSLTFSNTGSVTYGLANQADTLVLTGSNTGANTFTPLIANNGTAAVSVVKNGAGSWKLAGADSFSGGVAINNGTLVAGSSGALGTGGVSFGASNTPTLDLNAQALTTGLLSSTNTNAVVTNSVASPASLTVSGTGSATFAGVINDGSSVTSLTVAAGTQTLTGNNTYTGNTAIATGATLQIGGAGTLTNGTYYGNITANGTLQYSSSSDQNLFGTISGTGGLTKDTSSSVLTLYSSNTYTGTTKVNAGTLLIGTPNAISSASAVNLGSTGAVTTILQTVGNSQGTGASTTGGTVTGNVTTGGTVTSGTVTTVGLGALTLSGNASIDFVGDAATLVFNGYSQTGQTLLVVNYINLTSASSNNTSSGVDGNDARLIFNAAGLTTAQVSSLFSNVYFVDPNDLSFSGSGPTDPAAEIALGGGFYELVPGTAVPEPATYLGGVFLLAAAAWQYRRRVRQTLA